MSKNISQKLPATPLAGLQRTLIIIIEGFLVHLDQFLPLYFSADNFVKVLGSRGQRPSLFLGEFLLKYYFLTFKVSPITTDLLGFPFFLTARQMNSNASTAEVSAADVAGYRGHGGGWWWDSQYLKFSQI